MPPQKRNTAIYIGKVTTAIILCYLLSHAVSKIDYIWAMVSAMLVMSPEGKDAIELSLIRIKGNIIGVLVGVLFLIVELENPVNLVAGAAVSLFACHRLRLMAGARATLVAMVITMMHTESADHFSAAVTRVAAVVAGCAIALLATELFHNVLKLQYTEITEKTP